MDAWRIGIQKKIREIWMIQRETIEYTEDKETKMIRKHR